MAQRSQLIAIAASLVTLVIATAAPANAPPPPRDREPIGPKLVVQPSTEKVSRLSIPRKLVPGAEKKAEKSDAGDNGFLGSDRTVVAGIAMSAAVALLGLHLVRRRSGHGLAPTILIGAGMSALVGATALADLAIPGGGGRRPRPGPPPPNPPGTVTTPLVIDWTDDGDNVKLWISPEQLHQNAPGAAPEHPKPGAAPGSAPAK